MRYIGIFDATYQLLIALSVWLCVHSLISFPCSSFYYMRFLLVCVHERLFYKPYALFIIHHLICALACTCDCFLEDLLYLYNSCIIVVLVLSVSLKPRRYHTNASLLIVQFSVARSRNYALQASDLFNNCQISVLYVPFCPALRTPSQIIHEYCNFTIISDYQILKHDISRYGMCLLIDYRLLPSLINFIEYHPSSSLGDDIIASVSTLWNFLPNFFGRILNICC